MKQCRVWTGQAGSSWWQEWLRPMVVSLPSGRPTWMQLMQLMQFHALACLGIMGSTWFHHVPPCSTPLNRRRYSKETAHWSCEVCRAVAAVACTRSSLRWIRHRQALKVLGRGWPGNMIQFYKMRWSYTWIYRVRTLLWVWAVASEVDFMYVALCCFSYVSLIIIDFCSRRHYRREHFRKVA